jgi:hypothetical protein
MSTTLGALAAPSERTVEKAVEYKAVRLFLVAVS